MYILTYTSLEENETFCLAVSEHVDKLKEFAEKDAEETGLSTGQWTNNKAPCLIEDEHGQEECGTYVIDTIEQLT